MIRYRSCRPPETELRGRLRDLANERRRFGYRRLFILLRREGELSGINRIYPLYREEGLTVRKRRARRRAVGTRAPILAEARPNPRWSLDFVHDQFACGRRFRVLNIVDDVTRECLAAIPDTSISGRRVARELTDLISRRGKPRMIVSDHGTEFNLERYPGLVEGSPCRMALHRARQADAKRLCRILQRPDGGITPTKSDAFYRKFLTWAAEDFQWPGYEAEELYRLNKVLNEHDFMPLAIMRELMIGARLLRHYKGKAVPTKAGKAMIGDHGALQAELFDAYFLALDHGAYERFPIDHDDPDFVHFIGVIQNLLDDWVPMTELAGWCLPIGLITSYRFSPMEDVCYYLLSRLVRPRFSGWA